MQKNWLVQLALTAGALLVFWQYGIPWMKEQAYLHHSRTVPILLEQRITPENASRVQLQETWEEGQVLSSNFTLGEIIWLTPQEGRLLAWWDEMLVLASFPKGELLHTWQADPPVDGAAWEAHFSSDGRFVTAKYGNRVRSYAAQSGQALGPWLNASERFAISPDGTRLAWAGTLGLSEDPSRMGVYQTRDGVKLSLFKTRAFYWRDLLYSPDGALLVALGDDGQRTYASIGRTPVFRWLEPGGYQAAFSPNGLSLATAQTILSLKTRQKLLLNYPPPQETPFEVTFSPAGDLLVTSNRGGRALSLAGLRWGAAGYPPPARGHRPDCLFTRWCLVYAAAEPDRIPLWLA